MKDGWNQVGPQSSPVAAGRAFADGLGGSLQTHPQKHTGDSVASRQTGARRR